LPLSACRVVFVEGMGPAGAELCDPPQETRKPKSHSDPNAVKQRGKARVFTQITPRKRKPQSGY
jgi:hypothetical protein